MVTWKIQRRKSHVLNVLLFACIVFPSLNHNEIFLRKQNKIFWIDISIRTFVATFARFIKLGLQIRPSVVRGVVLRIWHATPT